MSGPGGIPVDPERWRRIEALLEEALDLAPDAQKAYLAAACAGDDSLRAEVQALLDADRGAGAFLEGTPLDLTAGTATPDEDAPVEGGRRIGAYRVLGEIGRGGMGIVYRARRDDGQFEQTVAIKLVRGSLDSAAMRQRFETERQILATLEHAHIARLVDGGVAADGRPWFAMEFVDGVPLNRYCRDHRVPLHGVIELFRQVCHAVQYAHRNLIVHRDLKPGNILVTPQGEVKLLDFGIARLIDPVTGAGEATAAAPRVLTPIYAAPEQVRGEPVTTATDVYSLGVVLYELVTGVRPYRARMDRLEDAQRAILTELPVSPSTAAGREASPPDPAGAAPGAPAPDERQLAWRRRLRGDLDHIVLMALRKEPERRYPSAEALRDDLDRYLEGRPVRATSPTTGYRVRKYVERHRGGVAAAAVVALALVAGVAATAWQAREAARERDRARAAAARAEEIKTFTLGLFSAADPAAGRADRMTVRELLDQGAMRVERELSGQPSIQAEMYAVLGDVYAKLSVNDSAESLLTRAVDLRREQLGVHDTSYANALLTLATHLSYMAQFDRAIPLAREALAIRRSANPATAGAALNDFAVTLNRAGRPAAAESLYLEAMRLDEARWGPDHVQTAALLNNYGLMLSGSEQDARAEPLLRRAVQIRARALGPEHLETAISREALAQSLRDLGRFAEADSQMRIVLRVRRRVLAPGHPDIGRSLANYGSLKQAEGNYAAAESLFLEALAIQTKALGDDHVDVISNMNNLAIVYYRMGDFGEAARWFGSAHTAMVRTLGPDHPGTLTCLTNVGVVLRESGRLEAADSALSYSLERRTALFGVDHPATSQSSHQLGVLRHRQGRLAEAERLLAQALAARRHSYEPASPRIGETAAALAGVLRDRGRTAAAAALYDEALRIARASYAEPHPQTADALEGKGLLLLGTHRAAAAEPLLSEALAIRREKQPRFAAGIATLEAELASCRAAASGGS